jgi:hypothetical protein
MDSDCLTTSTKIVCDLLDKFELYLIEYNKPGATRKTATSKSKAVFKRETDLKTRTGLTRSN